MNNVLSAVLLPLRAGPPAAAALRNDPAHAQSPPATYARFRSRAYLLIALQAAVVDALMQAVIATRGLLLPVRGQGGGKHAAIIHIAYLAVVLLQLRLHVLRKTRGNNQHNGSSPSPSTALQLVGPLAWFMRMGVHMACAAGLTPVPLAFNRMVAVHIEPFVELLHNFPCSKQVTGPCPECGMGG